jgi:peptidoglycan L-alanyl-D-glutamate endopeptidase CwlK
MINSRSLDDLNPLVAAKAHALLARCQADGIDLLVTSTYRDAASQAALYAQGRTAPGRIVTNAPPGQSFHNWRVAFDVVPLRHGKPIWDMAGENGVLWQQVGALGEAVGLEWAGRWKRFRELAHFQFTGGLTLADFQAGKPWPKAIS